MRDHIQYGLDTLWYRLVAGTIASGDGYVDPAHFYGQGVAVPTAFRPPLYPFVLAGATKALDGSLASAQLLGCVLGTLTVVLIGLLGRRLAGPAVGLVAAGLAAVSPALLGVDAAVMSESVYVPIVCGLLLVVLAARRTPTAGRWAGAGALVGLGILARGDGAVLLVTVVVAGALHLRDVPLRRRAGLAGCGVVACVAVLVPWAVRNEVQLGTPTIATLHVGTAIAGTNCPTAYGGSLLGSWDYDCTVRPDSATADEVALSNRLTDDGIAYAVHHVGRWPVVVPARVLRQWGLWPPGPEARLEAIESRNDRWQLLTWGCELALAAAAVYGFVVLRRRSEVDLMPFAGVVVGVTLSAVFIYGSQRLRIAAEPVLLVLAAAAVVDVAAHISRRRRLSGRRRGVDRSSTARADDGAPAPTAP